MNSATLTKPRSLKWREWMWGYFFVAPTMIGLFVLNIYPLLQTIYLSFTESGAFGTSTFVGIKNYQKIVQDAMIPRSFLNTILYACITVPFGVIFSLITASLLNSAIKGKTFYRTFFFLPVVSAPAAIAMVWRTLYNSDFGIINYLLSIIGFESIYWLTDPHVVLFSIAIVGIWMSIGTSMIILLAGLQEIPVSYYEAANIDGASPIRKFFSITLPLITPTLFFVIVTNLIAALQIFDIIYMMFRRSNPALPYVQSVVSLFYKYSFELNMKGLGSAIITLLFFLILMVTIIQLKLQKRWVHYNG